MGLDSFKRWLDEEEEDEQVQQTSSTVTPQAQDVSYDNKALDRESFRNWLETEEEESQVQDIREQGQQQVEQVQEPMQEPEEEKEDEGFFKRAGNFIKGLFLGEKEESDRRTDWERFQEEFIGFESKGGKENREAKQEYYEALGRGDEVVDTISEAQDLAKLKTYEIAKDKIRYWDEVVVPLVEERGMEEYDNIKKELEVEDWNINDLRASMKVLEEQLGMAYVSEGAIPEFFRNLEGGFAKGNAFGEGDPTFTTGFSSTTDKKGKAVQDKLEKEGWDSLTDAEQIDFVNAYSKELFETGDVNESLYDNVMNLVANSLGYGASMSTSAILTGGGTPLPSSQATGILKVLDTTAIKAIEAAGMSSLYDAETDKRYYDMVTPEYIYLVDEAGDLVVKKIQEAQREEGEHAKTMAKLGTFFEYFSESWGEILNVGSEEFLNSLAKTATFNKFATWALEKTALTEGTLKELLSKGRFDGLVGEFLEEELLEPIASLLENREYQGIDTPEGRERMLIEILGFGLTGTGASIQGYLENRDKKKAIEVINNNKETFGLPENREMDKYGNIVSTDDGSIIVPKEEVLKEPKIKVDEDRYDEILKDIEEKEAQVEDVKKEGDVYIEEGDQDITQYSEQEQQGVQEVVAELQADIDLGARKKLVTQDQEGEATIAVEGAVLPDYIPEDLRSRRVLQEAVDAVLEEKIPDEGSKAWEAYQILLEEGKNRVVAEEVEVKEYDKKESVNKDKYVKADTYIKKTFSGLDFVNTSKKTSSEELIKNNDVILDLQQDDERIVLSWIQTKDKNMGLGSEIVKEIKEFAESKNKIFEVTNVSNRAYWDSFGFFEDNKIGGYVYDPSKGIKDFERTPSGRRANRVALNELVGEVVQYEGKEWRVRYGNVADSGSLMVMLEIEGEALKTVGGKTVDEIKEKLGLEDTKAPVSDEKELIKEKLLSEEIEFDEDASIEELRKKLDDWQSKEEGEQIRLEDLPFRTNNAGRQQLDSSQLTDADQAEFKALNRELFGDEKVEILEQILTPERQQALGRYMDEWIQIRSGQADIESSYYHEAVHKALDIFLTPSEKQTLLTQVKNLVGEKKLREAWDKMPREGKYRAMQLTHGSKYEIIGGFNLDLVGTGEGNRLDYHGIYFNQSYIRSEAFAKSQFGKESKVYEAYADINPARMLRSTNEDQQRFAKDEQFEGDREDSAWKESTQRMMILDGLMDKWKEDAGKDYRKVEDRQERIKQEAVYRQEIRDANNMKDLYNLLARKLGSKKGASEFLASLGFDGFMEYTKDGWIIGIFDTGKIDNYEKVYDYQQGMFRGGDSKLSVDAMAEEWLAENIIAYINDQPTTFVGKLKAMVDRFIDRWFRTMDNIDSIDGFYKALLNGRLKERSIRLERQQAKAFNDYLNLDRANRDTSAVYRTEVAKQVQNLTTKILKMIKANSSSDVVSKQFISDLTKQKGIKKVEADLIKEVLKDFPDKVEVSTFENRVLSKLLPLERVQLAAPKYPSYFTLDSRELGEFEYNEVIYASPTVVTAGRIHFTMEDQNVSSDSSAAEKYFGHVRVESNIANRQRRVLELQSDLYQKGRIEEEGKQAREILEKPPEMKPEYTESLKFIKQEAEERLEEVAKLEQYNDPTAHLRMVREEIRKAALDGIEKIQFADGETSLKIEGQGSNQMEIWQEGGNKILTEENIKAGLTIGARNDPYGQKWLIMEVLDDGEYTVIEYDYIDSQVSNNDYLYNLAEDKGYYNEDGELDIPDVISDSEMMQELEGMGIEETFTLKEVDESNPLYIFYEKTLGKYLQKEYDAKKIEDKWGETWWEIEIKPEYAQAVEAFRLDDLVDYREVAKQFDDVGDFITNVFTEVPEYGMDHRPSYFYDAYGDFTQVMPRAFDLTEGGIVPSDVYEHPEWSISPNHNTKANQESWEALLEIHNRPEAEITVYRGSPKSELNVGDWVTFSKTYAGMGSESQINEFTVKAKDIVFAGDDINEFGYYPKDELIEIWKEANAKAKYRIEEEGDLVPIKLPELISLADDLDTDIQVKGKLGRGKGGGVKLGDFTPVATNGKDNRIRVLRKLFEPQGEEVVDASTGEIERLPETDEQRRERIESIEKVFSHEIGHLFDWYGGEDNKTFTRGNLLGRVANLVKYMRKEFRGYANKDIRNELKTLTQAWNPFDPNLNAKYTKYRYKGEELYAEAVSVLLNDPAMVKKIAPNFYNAFTEFLARKKEVKEAYLNIIDSIKNNTAIADRLANMDKGFEEARGRRMSIEERKEARKEQEKWQEEVITSIKTSVVSKYEPYLKKVREAYKKGSIELSRAEEAEQVLQDLEFVGNDTGKYIREIQENFFEPISEADISVDDVGKVLVLERDLGDRVDLANPQGLVYDYAKETYDELREKLGASKWAILKEKLDWWRDYNFQLVEKAYEAGVYSEQFFEEIARVNKNTYTPFGVIKYIDSNYVSAGIIQAKGTVSKVENPVTTQMMKSISIIEQTAVNYAKSDVVEVIKDSFPEDIKKAKAVRGENGRFVQWENNQELRDMGMDIIELREDGKRVGYWVDGYIKDMFEGALSGRDWKTLRVLTSPIRWFNRIFKPAVTVLKPSFQFYSNPIKDYKRSIVNISALAQMFDDANKGTINKTGKVFKAFTKEWFGNLKRSWGYAGGKLDKVTKKMLDMYILSEDIRYEDVELGTKEFSFDPVKGRVYYKSKANWLDSIAEFTRKIPLIGKVANIWDLYQRVGRTLEVNSKIAGFQTLRKEVGDKKAGYYTRQYVGTPNYMQKGRWTGITNELAVFSNVGIQALNADSKLATQPKTASGYWFSTFMTRIVPKLVMLAGASLLKVKIKDDDDEEKEVNPYDYISEYYKSMYNVFPVGYDKETGKFMFIKIPNDEIGALVGNLVWKMGRYLQGEGMKIEQLGVAGIGLIPLTQGENPFSSLVGDWLGYLQGRNPYDDFRGRLAINPSKWQEGGITRFTEMLKWSSNEMGLSNFQTYDKGFNTTKEYILEAPLLERMFELSDYGLQEKEIWEDMKAKKGKEKERDKLLQDYYAQPSNEMMLKKIDEYVKQVKGEEPEDGWEGDDKSEATRLKNDFKMEILAQSGDRKYTRVAKYGISNDEKEEIISQYQGSMDKQEFTDYMAELVRHEIVKGEMFAQYVEDNKLDDDQVYKIVKKSIPVLTEDSNNTLLWELRKRDMLSDESLIKLYREDKLITNKGFVKYRDLNSVVYERRYGD